MSDVVSKLNWWLFLRASQHTTEQHRVRGTVYRKIYKVVRSLTYGVEPCKEKNI